MHTESAAAMGTSIFLGLATAKLKNPIKPYHRNHKGNIQHGETEQN
jgi:hypothetical protein